MENVGEDEWEDADAKVTVILRSDGDDGKGDTPTLDKYVDSERQATI